MWFEGEVRVVDFPAKFAEILQTIPEGEDEPLWEMISSNVGETVDDDGYVFYSKGTSGEDNIYIGVQTDFPDVNWYFGHRFFITESYIPSDEPNTNGEWGRYITERHRYHNDSTYARVTEETAKIFYQISVTKDRVIIVTNNILPITDVNRINPVTYLGLIKRYSNEPDSSAGCIATSYGADKNYFNSVRLLRSRQKVFAPVYNVRYSNTFEISTGRKGYGGKFLATNIPLTYSVEGFRGELDGMLVTNFTSDYQGPIVPNNGYVLIDGKEYLCVYKPEYHLSVHDNFNEDRKKYAYFIEKK
ncbi:hypothetical protein ACSVDA_11915 [Cytobacillus sp. Hm23]